MASTAAKYILLMSGGGPNVAPLLRDEFLTDAAAPMGTSPITRNAEPGPGSVVLRQQDGVSEWHIVDGVVGLTAPSTAGTLPTLTAATGFTRAPGLAFRHRTAQVPNGTSGAVTASPLSGWSSVNTSASLSSTTGHWWYNALSSFMVNDSTPSITLYEILAPSSGVFYTSTHILRSAGSFTIVGDRLLMPMMNGTAVTMYPIIGMPDHNRHTFRTDYVRVAQLGGPWASDYGIATTRLAGACSVGNTFAHEPNAMWIDFVLTTLPSSGNIEIEFRRTDANNKWMLQVTSAGTFNLIEVVSGTPTTRINIASNANGDRLLCVMDGANARLGRYRVGACVNSAVYASVSTFMTQTSGTVSSLGTDGAISDLIAWPRVLSGEALAWVNAL